MAQDKKAAPEGAAAVYGMASVIIIYSNLII